jgi:hypothetical protein
MYTTSLASQHTDSKPGLPEKSINSSIMPLLVFKLVNWLLAQKKFFRLNNTGTIEIINSTYGATILSLTDAGVLNTPGGGTSDRRTKTNIEYITGDTLPTMLKLKPVKFDWDKRDGTYKGISDIGFIAQDLDDVQSKFGLEVFVDIEDFSDDDELENYEIIFDVPL